MYLDEGILNDLLGVLAVIEYLVRKTVGQRMILDHQRAEVIPTSLDDAVHPEPLRGFGPLGGPSSRVA